MTEKQKKIVGIVAFVLFCVFLAAVAFFIGRPMVKFVSEPDKFRDWVDEAGFLGRVLFIGMVVLQIIVAIIPGEPLEIGAGYAFGALEGTVLCLVACVIGSALVMALVRTCGVKLIEVFFPIEKIRSLKFLKKSKQRDAVLFLVMLLPGTPKDLLTYAVGLTDIKIHAWLLIVAVTRIPSVITSTVGGNALGTQNYLFAVLVFSATLVITLIGTLIYNKISNAKKEFSEDDTP